MSVETYYGTDTEWIAVWCILGVLAFEIIAGIIIGTTIALYEHLRDCYRESQALPMEEWPISSEPFVMPKRGVRR